MNYNGFEPEKKKKPEVTEPTIDPEEVGMAPRAGGLGQGGGGWGGLRGGGALEESL